MKIKINNIILNEWEPYHEYNYDDYVKCYNGYNYVQIFKGFGDPMNTIAVGFYYEFGYLNHLFNIFQAKKCKDIKELQDFIDNFLLKADIYSIFN